MVICDQMESNLCWEIIIPRLSFVKQLRLSQTNTILSQIAFENGEFQMKRLKSELRNNPFLGRKHQNLRIKKLHGLAWTFWRALTWVLEEDADHCDLVLLAKAERLGLEITKKGIASFYKKNNASGNEIDSHLPNINRNPDWMISVELSEDPSRPVDHEFTVRELSTGKYKEGFIIKLGFIITSSSVEIQHSK